MVNFIDTQFSYELNIDAKTQLLKEGDTAQKMFFIKKGSLRVWFNNNGTDVTAQFFFEGDAG